jgi:hypothetical protein
VPAHALLERFDLGQRRSRNRHQRHVVMLEMDESAVDVIGLERAADAAFLPSRAEHEMIDDQLAASIEEVGERLLAVRPIEQIGLFDPDPGQLAALPCHLVADLGQRLLMRQMRLARDQPFFPRDDFLRVHEISPLVRVPIADERLPETS